VSKTKPTSFKRYNSIVHIALEQWNEGELPNREQFCEMRGKQCSNSKYGVGVKIGEVCELRVVVLHRFDTTEGGKPGGNARFRQNHDFDVPMPYLALVVILTVNESVGGQVGDI
jgi:hypothetical protein